MLQTRNAVHGGAAIYKVNINVKIIVAAVSLTAICPISKGKVGA